MFHQLRIAIVTAWLHEFPYVTFETDAERDRVICMWLETPPETIALWIDSEWQDEVLA